MIQGWQPYLLIALIHLVHFELAGQRSFELNNPEAILLDRQNLSMLIGPFWVSEDQEMLVRDDTIGRFGTSYITYFSHDSFVFNGMPGSWELIDRKYIKHSLTNMKYEGELRFGGIFSVAELTDSTLTLVKLLTSSHDMKRTIYFHVENRENYFKHPSLPVVDTKQIRRPRKKKEKPIKVYKDLTPFLLEPDPKEFNRISKLRTDELIHYGFDFKGDTIYLYIKDSLYKVKRKERIN